MQILGSCRRGILILSYLSTVLIGGSQQINQSVSLIAWVRYIYRLQNYKITAYFDL